MVDVPRNLEPRSDTLRPAILGIMLNLIRTSPLQAKVDVSEMLQFISSNWQHIYHDGELDLEPVHQALIREPRVQPRELALIFLLLKKREDKLTCSVRLPKAVSGLPPAERDALLQEVAKLGVQSGVTLSGMKRVQPRIPEDEKPAEKEAAKEKDHAQEGLTSRVRAILQSKKDG